MIITILLMIVGFMAGMGYERHTRHLSEPQIAQIAEEHYAKRFKTFVPVMSSMIDVATNRCIAEMRGDLRSNIKRVHIPPRSGIITLCDDVQPETAEMNSGKTNQKAGLESTSSDPKMCKRPLIGLCHVCNGSGVIHVHGFHYGQVDGTDMCRTCEGKGFVII